MTRRSLIYYCSSSSGGIADYALAQSAALRELGVEVTFLAPRCLLDRHSGGCATEELDDYAGSPEQLPKWRRRLAHLGILRRNIGQLQRVLRARGEKHALLAAYAEYGAPMWSRSLETLTGQGISFAAVLHDPVRNHIVGPPWWHWYSVKRAYGFLSDVFVHEQVNRAECRIPAHVRVTVVPHGPYEFPSSHESRAEVRAKYGIPDDAYLLLSFGHIKDSKNLNLVLDAMRGSKVWLLVAGKDVGSGQKGIADYMRLAAEFGVADRCRWEAASVPADHVGGLFSAADAIAMTYSSAFRSASGVLNVAVHYEKPCLVSSGPGPLRTQTERYDLGVSIEPDTTDAIVLGLRQLQNHPPTPRWSEYKRENSWNRNAQVVADRMFAGT